MLDDPADIQSGVVFRNHASMALGLLFEHEPIRGPFTVDTGTHCTNPANKFQAYACAAIFEFGFLLLACLLMLGKPATSIFYVARGRDLLPEEQLRQVALLFIFGTNLIFTIVVPDSLLLATSRGQTAAASGAFIGIYKLVQVPGSILMWYFFRKGPNVWLDNIQFQYVAYSSLLVLSSLLYWVAASHNRPRFFGLLMLSRCISGLAGGMSAQLARQVMARTVSAENRQPSLTRLNFAIILGIGLGPLAGAMATDAYETLCKDGAKAIAWQQQSSFEVTGQSQVIVSIFLLFVSVFKLPTPEQVKMSIVDLGNQTTECTNFRRGEEAEHKYALCRQQICFCIFVATARGMMVSGLEAAVAMLLERVYGWHTSRTGMVVSGTFLMLIPGRFLYNIVGDQHLPCRLRILVCTFLTSTVSVFDFSNMELGPPSRIATLLLGCAVFFPCIFLISGSVEGFMLRNALPANSWFALDNLILLQTVCTDGLGRFSGPIVARYELETWGQNSFAAQHLFVAFLASIAVEAVLQLQKSIDVVCFRRHMNRWYGSDCFAFPLVHYVTARF
eukprot:TRINITY_DN5528_c0_g1_i1.p1 TRINITY_DN5528_c0_g1~~TRINITY_DN5528_c0_g1_i1.p1  ORF type:complete len:560 (+),score=45.93 TRINITY_DN5528_c0_g1_i1:121-1800(+)